MTNPSDRITGLTPSSHERTGELTDSDVNDDLERGNIPDSEFRDEEIRHDEGAQPDADRADAPQPPTRESED